MKKRVFIIHGWGGVPDVDWYSWLKRELENLGYEVQSPSMPNTMRPTIEEWVSKIKEIVGEVDKDMYFVGHSMGCQAIMRYLERLPEEVIVKGVVFVAGWFNLTDETWDEDYLPEIAKPWIDTPIDFSKVKKHAKRFVAVYSDNDPYVPVSDSKLFKERLGAEVILEKNKGHITGGDDNVTELPIVLEKILEMSK